MEPYYGTNGREFIEGRFMVGVPSKDGGKHIVVDGYYELTPPEQWPDDPTVSIDVWVNLPTLIKLYDGPYLMRDVIAGDYESDVVDDKEKIFWIGENLVEPATMMLVDAPLGEWHWSADHRELLPPAGL